MSASMTDTEVELFKANERIAELKYERDTYSHNLDKMLAENERLREMNNHLANSDSVACLQDAELYQWLKENSDYVSTVVGNIEVTDEAIEAAMRGEA